MLLSAHVKRVVIPQMPKVLKKRQKRCHKNTKKYTYFVLQSSHIKVFSVSCITDFEFMGRDQYVLFAHWMLCCPVGVGCMFTMVEIGSLSNKFYLKTKKKICSFYIIYFQMLVYVQNYSGKKSCIKETPNLHSDAERSTDT